MITKLEDFKAYNQAMELAESIWSIVMKWGYFEKDTVGKQFVRAADSIAANLSEGLGRYHFKETKNFGYYSRGSLFETKTWLAKSMNRKLVTPEQCATLMMQIEIIGKMVNSYINSVGSVREPDEVYNTDGPALMPNP
jgi:four helix bundle protein